MAKKAVKAVESNSDKTEVLLEENKLKFYTLYDFCNDRIEGNISETKFIDYLNKNLIVSKYISLGTKRDMIFLFYAINDELNDYSNMTYMFELYSVLFMLFAYTNIEISDEEINENNYNVAMESGLVDYIKEKVGKDFNIFYNMIINSMNFKGYQLISMFADSLNIDEIKNFSIETQKVLGDMDIEKLSLLKTILEFNDPSLNKLNNDIYKGVEGINIKK